MKQARKFSECKYATEEPFSSLLEGKIKHKSLDVGQPASWDVIQFPDKSILAYGACSASSAEFYEVKVFKTLATAKKFFNRPENDRGLLDYVFRLGGRLAPNGRKYEMAVGRKLKEGETVRLEDIAHVLGISAVVRICKYADKKDIAIAARIVEEIAEKVQEKYGTDFKKDRWYDTIGNFLKKAKKIKKYGKGKINRLSYPLMKIDELEEIDTPQIIKKYRVKKGGENEKI